MGDHFTHEYVVYLSPTVASCCFPEASMMHSGNQIKQALGDLIIAGWT